MEVTQTIAFSSFLKSLRKRGTHPLIITDETIASIYFDFIKKTTLPYLIIPSGEGEKSRERKAAIEDYLLERGYGRNTELIAFGGGVISDLVGFVAATYMRGVAFSIIPTTLTAFVDASVGGKNGINTSYGKNLIGTFYPPVDVCLEEKFLTTLPKQVREEQFAEIIKIALTSDRDLFFSMENPLFRARQLKMDLVQKDPKDLGERAILNFGHTFAHAYEALLNYRVSHGKAVLIGLYFESLLSYHLKILPQKEWKMIQKVLKKYPQKIFPISFEGQALFKHMCRDKKNKDQAPCFILLKKIGEIYCEGEKIVHEVSLESIIAVSKKMSKETV
jgi:3-dehydroquinate synthase